MTNVTAMRPNGQITIAELLRYGSDPELEHYQIVCHWKDGSTTSGWSGGITNGQLMLGVACMQKQANDAVFTEE